MTDYLHYRFTPERRRMQADSLAPPLRRLEKWAFESVGYPPKIAAGKVFLSFLDGRLAAFEEGSAKLLWNFHLPRGHQDNFKNNSDLLISGNSLLTRLDREMFILDTLTGKLRDHFTVPEFDARSAVLQENRLFGIYVDGEDDEEPIYCFAYDLECRDFAWKHAIELIPKSLTMSVHRIFLSNKKGYFTCLSAETGAQIWTTSLQEIGKYLDIDRTIRYGDVTGVPLLWGDLVIVPVEGYHVIALDQETGAVRWSQSLDIDDPRNLAYSPDGFLSVGDCEIFVNLDVATGHIFSQMSIGTVLHPYGGPLLTQMDVTDRFAYFSTIHNGILIALDRWSGEIPWTFQCATAVPFDNAPVVVHGCLYLLDEDQNLYVFAGQPA